ncbi:hypothetical protein TNIN_451071 [Trichonephila inaurata madagascariensis]|uniref:Uncharacterized protein n=1 Tax=Trichonephila inaurata madagascariensis TaxID=2747483 RepID=A0A8X6X3U8_9ARAC|nr:hypothetical protein TNIN_451071 [Trichonephila inaurata madagascariensis]
MAAKVGFNITYGEEAQFVVYSVDFNYAARVDGIVGMSLIKPKWPLSRGICWALFNFAGEEDSDFRVRFDILCEGNFKPRGLRI